MNFSLSLNTLDLDNRSKSQFCVDCQYNKIKNEMSVLLLITFFRIQNNSILSQKTFYHHMLLNAFCHFFLSARNDILQFTSKYLSRLHRIYLIVIESKQIQILKLFSKSKMRVDM